MGFPPPPISYQLLETKQRPLTLSLPRVIGSISNFPCSLTRNMTSHQVWRTNNGFSQLVEIKDDLLPMYTYLTYAYHYLTFKLGSEKVKCSLAVPFVDNISLLPFLLSVWEILWCTVFVQQTLPLPYPRVKLWPHVCVPLPLLELLILLPQSWRSVEWRILECSLLLLGLAVTFQANLSLSWYGVINQVLVEKKEWLILGRMQCWQLITQFVLLLFPFAQVLGGGGGGGGVVGWVSTVSSCPVGRTEY